VPLQANATSRATDPGGDPCSRAAGGARTGVPVAAGRKGFKAELDGLRERMRALGLSHDEIAAEVSRRFRARPREAYRLAWGWTLDQAAERFNQRAAREGTDPQARASMTGPHLCEAEKWPRSTRRPSVYVLSVLAAIYETGILSLLDLDDHESLPQHDRLVLLRRPHGELAGAAARPGKQEPPGGLDDQAASPQPGITEGMSLTLPYVPGRLVLEVAGPAGNAGWLADGVDREAAPGRLALVRDNAPGQATGR
jgi:hypothetical protein